MENCVFCKIAKGEIAKEFDYENEDIMVFPDLHPLRPIHLLIVPKVHIPDFLDAPDLVLLKIFNTAKKLVREKKLENKGYRLVINGGGAQIIHHLHLHLLAPLSSQAKM
ncbi:MAG: hypothetical protein A2W22_01240 [Candidatus Levybacteria bacterium RBG_16_35_11]|nr:MAG: hypothetical protein A2W22_01240 [Candidatus Levybacteria bacterium RBG_16_35_11]